MSYEQLQLRGRRIDPRRDAVSPTDVYRSLIEQLCQFEMLMGALIRGARVWIGPLHLDDFQECDPAEEYWAVDVSR